MTDERLILNIDAIRAGRITIATPMYGGQCHADFCRSVASLHSLCATLEINLTFATLSGNPMISLARNVLVDQFLQIGSEYLIFIDADQEFDAKDVLLIAHYLATGSGYDVVGAAVPKKMLNWPGIRDAARNGVGVKDPLALLDFSTYENYNLAGGHCPSNDGTTPFEVAAIGTGFMGIRAGTFHRMSEEFPEQQFYLKEPINGRSKPYFAFFQEQINRGLGPYIGHDMIERIIDRSSTLEEIRAIAERVRAEEAKYGSRYLSEDYFFCHRVRDAGMRVWVAPGIRVVHYGMHGYGKRERRTVTHQKPMAHTLGSDHGL